MITWKEKLNSRLGARVFEAATRETEIGRRTWRLGDQIAFGLTIVVLATPILLALCGGWLVWVGGLAWYPTIYGILLLALAYSIFPSRARNRAPTFRSKDLPQLFGLLERIATEVDAEPPDGVHFDGELNAYMTEFGILGRHDRVLGIGFLLWEAADGGEKIALLAHELAHQVNGDPTRGAVLNFGLETLEGWYYFLTPDTSDGEIGTLVIAPFLFLLRLPIGLMWVLLVRLTFLSAQRAEYLADAMSARVAGKDATMGLLKKLLMAETVTRSLEDLYPFSRDQNGRIFDHGAAALRAAPRSLWVEKWEEAEEKESSVDETHPPTAFRIRFLASLPTAVPLVREKEIDFEAIAAELEPHKNKVGKQLMQEMEVQ